jgi:hypothetical protein
VGGIPNAPENVILQEYIQNLTTRDSGWSLLQMRHTSTDGEYVRKVINRVENTLNSVNIESQGSVYRKNYDLSSMD